MKRSCGPLPTDVRSVHNARPAAEPVPVPTTHGGKKVVKKVLTWAPDDVQWAARSGRQPGRRGRGAEADPGILDSVRR